MIVVKKKIYSRGTHNYRYKLSLILQYSGQSFAKIIVDNYGSKILLGTLQIVSEVHTLPICLPSHVILAGILM